MQSTVEHFAAGLFVVAGIVAVTTGEYLIAAPCAIAAAVAFCAVQDAKTLSSRNR